MRDECAKCACTLRNTTQWVSSLYGANSILLCKDCGKAEEQQIEDKGTNDIPELLLTYQTEY